MVLNMILPILNIIVNYMMYTFITKIDDDNVLCCDYTCCVDTFTTKVFIICNGILLVLTSYFLTNIPKVIILLFLPIYELISVMSACYTLYKIQNCECIKTSKIYEYYINILKVLLTCVVFVNIVIILCANKKL